VFGVAWSLSGDKLAVSAWDGYVYVFSPGGEELWHSEDLGGRVWSVAWSPDGSKLVVGVSLEMIYVFDSQGDILWESENLGGVVMHVSWSPCYDMLAVGTSEGGLYVFGTIVYGVINVSGIPGSVVSVSGPGAPATTPYPGTARLSSTLLRVCMVFLLVILVCFVRVWRGIM